PVRGEASDQARSRELRRRIPRADIRTSCDSGGINSRDGPGMAQFFTKSGEGEIVMPKFLLEATYSADGLKGLQRDKASGRKQAVTKAVEGLGGKVEAFYYALGERDVILILDLPDTITGAALAVNVSATGLVRTKTTPLLTVEEADQALSKGVE